METNSQSATVMVNEIRHYRTMSLLFNGEIQTGEWLSVDTER